MATQWTTDGNDVIGRADADVRIDCNNNGIGSGNRIVFSANTEADELMRLQDDGTNGIGTTDPQERLQVNGSIRIGDGTSAPAVDNRVWTTEKVFNVLDYGAVPIADHRCYGVNGLIEVLTPNIIEQDGRFGHANPGDTLWIMNGPNIGTYVITACNNNTATVAGAGWTPVPGGGIRWKVTGGTLSDCTGAFQDAIDAATVHGGVVLVPSGYYYFSGNIVVRRNVILRGMWTAPPAWDRDMWENGGYQD